MTPTPTRAEPWRPHWHFTPGRNWMNDPNGLIWLDGEYHLFYQYNPEGDQWGHMSWAHAVSTDLLHWQELPLAIPEDSHAAIFSGSCVHDADNTSGLGTDGQGPLIAIYTAAIHWGNQVQHIAYSNDHGRTWTKYAGNPVLDRGMKDFRDPKVFWHEPTGQWVMLVSLAHEARVAFYGSPDLKAWTLLSEFGPVGVPTGLWECPDLIELPVRDAQGRPEGRSLWVFKVDVFDGHPTGGSGAQAFIGEFDGRSFRLIEGGEALFPDLGADFYAAIAWANLPADQDRQVWLGWMSCHRYAKYLPTAPWRGAMSVPREIALQRDGAGRLRLLQRPVPELDALRCLPHLRGAIRPLSGWQALPDTGGQSFDLTVSIEPGQASAFGLQVLSSREEPTGGQAPAEGTRIGVDVAAGRIWIDRGRSGYLPPEDAPFAGRRSAPLPAGWRDAPLRLRVLADHSTVEVFVGDGELSLSELVLPAAGSTALAAWAEGGEARLCAFEQWAIARALG